MSEFTQIYLDNHATTPVDPRVLEAMIPSFKTCFGNAASATHEYGWAAAKCVDTARKKVAESIGSDPKDIVFTSGGTEADNLALIGIYEAYKGNGNHIVTTKVEHKAVLETCHELERRGAEVTYLGVDKEGYIDLSELEKAITDKTILVSILFGNNEVGTIQNMKAVGEITSKKSVFLHTDAVQAFGKTPIDVDAMKVDLLSLSGHKIYGPKGIGALYARQRSPRIKLHPLLFGGGQERGLRSGTLNVPGIVGFGKACELAVEDMKSDNERLIDLKAQFLSRIQESFPKAWINGPKKNGLPNNISLTLPGYKAPDLIQGIKKIAFSTGSACSSDNPKPSYVLSAIGLSDEDAFATIRFGLGRMTTQEEVEIASQEVIEYIKSNPK